jgi:hypothetical protein
MSQVFTDLYRKFEKGEINLEELTKECCLLSTCPGYWREISNLEQLPPVPTEIQSYLSLSKEQRERVRKKLSEDFFGRLRHYQNSCQRVINRNFSNYDWMLVMKKYLPEYHELNEVLSTFQYWLKENSRLLR